MPAATWTWGTEKKTHVCKHSLASARVPPLDGLRLNTNLPGASVPQVEALETLVACIRVLRVECLFLVCVQVESRVP